MPGSTSPDNIIYPVPSDPVAPLNAVFQDMAESVQDALTDINSDISNFGVDDLADVTVTAPNEGDFLVYDGAEWVNSGGFIYRTTVYFTSNGVFEKGAAIDGTTPTPWLRAIKVNCVGGGGGGGGAGTNGHSGGGGGGGEYVRSFLTNLGSLSASETVTVGTGGNGGAAGDNDGAGGGASSLGTFVTASGGGGGGKGSVSNGGNGGSGGTGDFAIRGGGGGSGSTVVGAGSGSGGNSGAGGGNAPGVLGAADTAGLNGVRGGGGSGGSRATGNVAGGNGGAGFVAIDLYA